MNQMLVNSINELIQKNEGESLLFELNKMIYIINGGKVYSVLYVNDLVTEVRMNRNDQAFKVYINRVAEIIKLYKDYRLQVIYWHDFDKERASRNLLENKLEKLMALIGDDLLEISNVEEFLMEDIDLELVSKSLEENLVLF